MQTTNKEEKAVQIFGTEFKDKYTTPIKSYDNSLVITEEYKETLPDIQDSIYDIEGGKTSIEHVGINNFRLPLKYDIRGGGQIELETSVTGTVSLEASKRGVHMSRIMEQFYEYKDQYFNIDLIEKILNDYRKTQGAFDARILLSFSYPIIQKSLRSNKYGYQYYDVTFEVKAKGDEPLTKIIHFDFVYSSACPCSEELSEHARKYRGRAAIPHSQRSKVRVSVKFDETIWIEDLKEMCLEALKTETQVIVKRIDEQAFAELNGANPKFVEDASRLLYSELCKNEKILDFKIMLSHRESLHSFSAIAVIIKGLSGRGAFNADISKEEIDSLIC